MASAVIAATDCQPRGQASLQQVRQHRRSMYARTTKRGLKDGKRTSPPHFARPRHSVRAALSRGVLTTKLRPADVTDNVPLDFGRIPGAQNLSQADIALALACRSREVDTAVCEPVCAAPSPMVGSHHLLIRRARSQWRYTGAGADAADWIASCKILQPSSVSAVMPSRVYRGRWSEVMYATALDLHEAAPIDVLCRVITRNCELRACRDAKAECPLSHDLHSKRRSSTRIAALNAGGHGSSSRRGHGRHRERLGHPGTGGEGPPAPPRRGRRHGRESHDADLPAAAPPCHEPRCVPAPRRRRPRRHGRRHAAQLSSGGCTDACLSVRPVHGGENTRLSP